MRAAHTPKTLLLVAVACGGLVSSQALTAGAFPATESFESYADGHLIVAEESWSGAVDAGVVSTNPAAVGALMTYTNSGGAFPLPDEPHAKVLAVGGGLTNTVSSVTGGVVVTEWLVMPTLREEAYAPGDDNYQVAFYVNTNKDVVVWRRDLSPATNDWLVLASTPTIDTGTWMRVSLTMDYATDRYQLAIDGTTISDAEGEQRDGTPDGTWFHMVQTNGAMSRFRAVTDETTYVDDLLIVNRSLSYSGTTFIEAESNDGSMPTSQTVTLSRGTFADPLTVSDVTADGVPSGLSVQVSRVNDTTATIRLTGHAAAPHLADQIATVEFLDSAFVLGAAASVAGYTNPFTLDFHDGFGVTWPTTIFGEAPVNEGTMSNTISLTLVGDTFVDDGDVGLGDEYMIASGSVPAGLELAVTYVDGTHVTLALNGSATSHNGVDGVFTLAFTDAAFATRSAASLTESSQALTVDFLGATSLSYSDTVFVEASNNNGTIGNAITATLANDTLAGDARTLTSPTDYTLSSGAVPGGLGLAITSDGADELTLILTGSISPHAASNSGAFAVSFTDAVFANVAPANITGVSQALDVTFDDQPVISYSGSVFNELANGAMDNVVPIEITIAGDTFDGADGADFVAAGKVSAANVPDGLALVLTKSSDTTLVATLSGTATSHASPDDDITNMSISLLDSALSLADADQVVGQTKSDLAVTYNNDTLTINTVPYMESFESYADGLPMTMNQGWQPNGGATVTTDADMVSALRGSFSEFPIETTHAKVLRATDETTDEIKSAPGANLYTDVMLYVTPRESTPTGYGNYQVAFYVNTNSQLVVWQDGSGGPEWLTLTDSSVTTGAWHRFTIVQDQSRFRFQIYMDGPGLAFSDAAGYETRTGSTQPGTWFNMVGKAGYMSRVRLAGPGHDMPAYMDDLVVTTEKPEHLIVGSLFLFR